MVLESLDVAANGIVLLDTAVLHETLGWSPAPGERRDLMREFFNSDLGDDVIAHGAVAPLLSIDDGGYEVICRLASEPSPVEELVIVTFRGFRGVEEGRIIRAGYEFVCEPTPALVAPTGQIDAYIRVFF